MYEQKLYKESKIEVNAIDTTEQKDKKKHEIDNIIYGTLRDKQLAILQALTHPTITHLTLDHLFQAVTNLIREIMQADTLVILLLTEDKKFLIMRASLEPEKKGVCDVSIPFGSGFAGQIAAQGMPLIIQGPACIETANPALQHHVQSLLGVPLITQEHIIGVMHIGMLHNYTFTKQDIQLFQHCADCLALAIKHTMLRELEQRILAKATQRTLQTSNIATLTTMVEALLKVSTLTNSESSSGELSSLTSQLGECIVTLTQSILNCSRTCLFTIDQYTHAFHLVAPRDYSSKQDQHFKMTTLDAHLSYLLSDPVIIARLEAQEILSFDPVQLPFFSNSEKDTLPAMNLLAPICASQQLIGLLGIAFVEDQQNNEEDITLIKTMTKLSALTLEYEHKTDERDTLLGTLQLTNTQMVQSNARLEQINKSLNDFIMTMGHEFRTALTGIQGFSELLCEEDCSKEEVKDYATDIQADAQRLSRMINGLLDLERMKTGKMTLRLDTIDLNAIITEVVTRIHLTTRQYPISLHLDESLPALVADHDKIIQVMVNLMSNAIKYSPVAGAITVSSKREEQMAHVTVRDHGIGIPKEALEQVFIPYNRLESATTRYVQGTGLGLPIVRQIIEMHGGRTWAESEPEQGSFLHFTLPIKRTRQL